MTTITILDPTASLAHDVADPGPAIGTLRGKRIAIRIDMLWRSWDWVSGIRLNHNETLVRDRRRRGR